MMHSFKLSSVVAVVVVVVAMTTMMTSTPVDAAWRTTRRGRSSVSGKGLGDICPDIAVRSDFNLTAYLGDWYEIATTPMARRTFEKDCSCTKANYSLMKNANATAAVDGNNSSNNSTKSTIKVVNSCHKEGVNGTHTSTGGEAKVGAEPAKLLVRFSKFAPFANYWVIGGDAAEKEYVVVWSCNTPTFEILWILAREPTLDDETYKRAIAEATRATHGAAIVDTLTKTVQSGCEY
jgi:lipocalin